VTPGCLLELKGGTKTREDSERRFDLEVPLFQLGQAERIALVGRSGSGKSTLIELLAATLKPDRLEAFAVRHPEEESHRDLAAAWTFSDDVALAAARARCFGYVQQLGGLLDFLTAGQNIALSLEFAGAGGAEHIAPLAEELGIARYLKVYPDRLSVGERQRVAIARALIHRPALILADEPTGALDLGTAQQVMGQLVERAEAWGTSLVIATHDPVLAERFGFRLVEAEVTLEGRHQRTRFQCVRG